jgi:hypothetical protein
MLDHALELETFLPPPGERQQFSGYMDLGVDQPGFSDNWRQGRLRLTWPALPNHTNEALNITVTLQDSGDWGKSFQNIEPPLQFQIAGVAITGVPAGSQDLPLPPGLRGPLTAVAETPNGAGDSTAARVYLNYCNE